MMASKREDDKNKSQGELDIADQLCTLTSALHISIRVMEENLRRRDTTQDEILTQIKYLMYRNNITIPVEQMEGLMAPLPSEASESESQWFTAPRETFAMTQEPQIQVTQHETYAIDHNQIQGVPPPSNPTIAPQIGYTHNSGITTQTQNICTQTSTGYTQTTPVFTQIGDTFTYPQTMHHQPQGFVNQAPAIYAQSQEIYAQPPTVHDQPQNIGLQSTYPLPPNGFAPAHEIYTQPRGQLNKQQMPSMPTRILHQQPQWTSTPQVNRSRLQNISNNPIPGATKLKVDQFDGTQGLEDYFLHFNVVASAMGWNIRQKGTVLAASLRGDALNVMATLKENEQQDWTALTAALKLRFGRDHLTGLKYLEFKARRQRHREDLSAYASALRTLAQKALPTVPPDMQDTLAKQHFLDGILDLELQDWVRFSRPETLNAALETALEIEASRKATRASRPMIRTTEIEENNARPPTNPRNFQGAIPKTNRGPTYPIHREETQTRSPNLPGPRQQGYGNNNYRRPNNPNVYQQDYPGNRGPQPTDPRPQPRWRNDNGPPQNTPNRNEREASNFYPRQPENRPQREWPDRRSDPLPGPSRQVQPEQRYMPRGVPPPMNGRLATIMRTIEIPFTISDSIRGIEVDCTLNGIPCSAVLDTGASGTIIGKRMNEYLGGEKGLLYTPFNLRAIDGKEVALLGERDVEVELGGHISIQRVMVGDVMNDCLLGMEFFKQTKAVLDIGKGSMILTTENSDQTHERSGRILRTLRDVEIPPYSEMIVDTQGTEIITGGLIEKLPIGGPAAIARTIVAEEDGILPVRMGNFTSKPLQLKARTAVAQVEAVEELIEGNEIPNIAHAESTLPEHVSSLFRDSCEHLTNESEVEHLYKLLSDFSDIFATNSSDRGRTLLTTHRIDTGDAAPLKQPARRVPPARAQEMEQLVEEMTLDEVIEPSMSPWSSPVVLVRKKDGKWRFCVDYRKLNHLTKKDSFPLPRIDDTLDSLHGAKWFSTMDLQSGYWQVEMHPDDKEKTAFTTGRGLYQFNVMPFGLTNAPATFERLMSAVLNGLPWGTCLVYLDDLIVYGETVADNVQKLRQVFNCLRAANLKLAPAKCKLLKKETEFLGHVVSDKGIKAAPGKISAVETWPIPTTKKQVRQFLGLCSYYRKFVLGFADKARPLHQLTEKNRVFKWTQECQNSFEELKHALTSSPILAYPRGEGLFILDCDASAVGTGAVLQQVQDNEEHVVAYYSQVLQKPERNYCVTRRELLAIVKGVIHFHHWLYGRHFIIRSDHGSLRWITNLKNPEGQTARWLERLEEYDYTIQHRPGRVHSNADTLSRRPCFEFDCTHCKRIDENDQVVRYATIEKRDQAPRRVAAVTLILNEEETIKKEQLEDPDLSQVIQWVQNQERPEWKTVSGRNPTLRMYWGAFESLQWENDKLVYVWEDDQPGREKKLTVLPRKMIGPILEELHNRPSGGHFGVNKTHEKLRERFYFPGSKSRVQQYCKECDICEARKGPTLRTRGRLQPMVTGAPGDRLAMDILGPLTRTPRGNKFVLVVMDYFTKWPELLALTDQSAISVANALVDHVICRFGVPREIHSDQGRNFESELVAEVMDILGCDRTRTTALHPQSDGMVERHNRTILDYLAKFVDENQENWDEMLPLFGLAYRSAVQESTGFSPAMMTYGREIRLPVDLRYGRPDEGEEPIAYVEDLRNRMDWVYETARTMLNKVSDEMKTRYDRNANVGNFQEGNQVWLYNPKRRKGRCPKLQRDWEGPYQIIKKINDVICRIKLTERRSRVIHIDRLAPYRGRQA